MTRTYAILLLFVAIAVLIFGIKAWIKMFSSKEIIKFPFAQKKAEFSIQDLGYYAIYIHAKNFRLLPAKWIPKIKSASSSIEIPIINSSFFSVRSNNFDGGKMEKFGFEIKTPGKYVIEIVEGEFTLSKIRRKFEESIIPNGLFSESNPKDLFISIRKGPSLLQKALLFPQLFLAFVGLFGIVFMSILVANPKALDKPITNISNEKNI
jgi:hypothetical protein